MMDKYNIESFKKKFIIFFRCLLIALFYNWRLRDLSRLVSFKNNKLELIAYSMKSKHDEMFVTTYNVVTYTYKSAVEICKSSFLY